MSGSSNKTYTSRWRGRKYPTWLKASCKLSTYLYIKMSIIVPFFHKHNKLPDTQYFMMPYISWALSPMSTHKEFSVSIHHQGHWVSACIPVKPLYKWVLQRQENLLTFIQLLTVISYYDVSFLYFSDCSPWVLQFEHIKWKKHLLAIPDVGLDSQWFLLTLQNSEHGCTSRLDDPFVHNYILKQRCLYQILSFFLHGSTAVGKVATQILTGDIHECKNI